MKLAKHLAWVLNYMFLSCTTTIAGDEAKSHPNSESYESSSIKELTYKSNGLTGYGLSTPLDSSVWYMYLNEKDKDGSTISIRRRDCEPNTYCENFVVFISSPGLDCSIISDPKLFDDILQGMRHEVRSLELLHATKGECKATMSFKGITNDGWNYFIYKYIFHTQMNQIIIATYFGKNETDEFASVVEQFKSE